MKKSLNLLDDIIAKAKYDKLKELIQEEFNDEKAK